MSVADTPILTIEGNFTTFEEDYFIRAKAMFGMAGSALSVGAHWNFMIPLPNQGATPAELALHFERVKYTIKDESDYRHQGIKLTGDILSHMS
jgi:hypothetical protein